MSIKMMSKLKWDDAPLRSIQERLRTVYGKYNSRIVKADYGTMFRHEVYVRRLGESWRYVGNLEEGIDLLGKKVRLTK